LSSSSSSFDDDSVRIRDHAITSTSETTEQTTGTIKDVARDIVEASSSIRELILTLHHIGAMEEIGLATRAIRDTANEINDTLKNLNERGTIKDTADAVEATAIATQDTIHILKVATREVAETAPTTLKTLKEVSNKVRSQITKKSLH
jgi:methyl-accepting chemotaxis protein